MREWEATTNNKLVLQAIKGFEIKFTEEPYQYIAKNPDLNSIDEEIVDKLVHYLLSIGAIRKVENSEIKFVSPIFPVPKHNGKHRLVLNLKQLNKFIKSDHFKMEDWRTVRCMMSTKMFMVKLDLKDAYHLVPMGINSKQYLTFFWKNLAYQYQCLPFGLSVAPFIFTKIMKEIIKVLRARGHLSVIYLDDLLLMGETKEECEENLHDTMTMLNKLGFLISEKSVVIPTQEIEYLGLIFNSVEMTISLPTVKKTKILTMCQKFLKNTFFTIREVAEFVGTLTSACPGVRNGPLYTRQLEVEKQQALVKNHGDYSSLMQFTGDARSDIEWWSENINRSNIINRSHYDITITSDASLVAWGATSNGKETRGKWTLDEQLLHINCLELKAVEYALHSFVTLLSNKRILLEVDNKCAISYINRYGGCRSPEMHRIAKRVWEWCDERNHSIFATYIKSKDNFIADELSRSNEYYSEWALGDHYFSQICKFLGKPDVDLFASYNNYKCSTYCSWRPDPKASFVDAFSFEWKGSHFYAFPPFAVVGKVLQKIRDEQSMLIVVAPSWSSQPWYPYYMSMAVSEILYLGPNRNLLICPYSSESHPLKSLRLMAAVLSGQRSNPKGFVKKQSM